MADNCEYWRAGKCAPPGLDAHDCSWANRDFNACAVYKAVAVRRSGGSWADALRAADAIPPGATVVGGVTVVGPGTLTGHESGTPARATATSGKLPTSPGQHSPPPPPTERGPARETALPSSTEARPNVPTLLLLGDDGTERSARPIQANSTTFIGAAVGGANGLCVQGQGIANVHCRIEADGQACFIVNSCSAGTSVNGTKVTRTPLQEGDIVTIGNVKMRFSRQSAPKRAPDAVTPAATVAAPSGRTSFDAAARVTSNPENIQAAAPTRAADSRKGQVEPFKLEATSASAHPTGADRKCPKCGAIYPATDTNCRSCGSSNAPVSSQASYFQLARELESKATLTVKEAALLVEVSGRKYGPRQEPITEAVLLEREALILRGLGERGKDRWPGCFQRGGQWYLPSKPIRDGEERAREFYLPP